jgi:hypothetical protein
MANIGRSNGVDDVVGAAFGDVIGPNGKRDAEAKRTNGEQSSAPVS